MLIRSAVWALMHARKATDRIGERRPQHSLEDIVTGFHPSSWHARHTSLTGTSGRQIIRHLHHFSFRTLLRGFRSSIISCVHNSNSWSVEPQIKYEPHFVSIVCSILSKLGATKHAAHEIYPSMSSIDIQLSNSTPGIRVKNCTFIGKTEKQ